MQSRSNRLRPISGHDSPRNMAAAVSSRGGAIIKGPTGIEVHLPVADNPVAPTYRKCLYCPHTHVLRTSTHFGTNDSNDIARGKVGDGAMSPEEAKNCARNAGLRLLATIHRFVEGDMSRVEQILKLTGLVNGVPSFEGHGGVINGCSEVLIEALGSDIGVGARSCTGVGSLGACVTCDLEVRVRPA